MIKYKDLAQGAKVIPISRAAPHFIDESVARKPIPPEQMGQMHVLTPRPNWSKLDLENDRIEIFHNLNLEQTLELERLDFVILPNSVIDHILQNPKLREKYAKLGLFPCRTGTWVDLDEENCIIKQDGKTKEIRLHTKNGWYKKTSSEFLLAHHLMNLILMRDTYIEQVTVLSFWFASPAT